MPAIELGCAGLAGALWYLAPQLGAWPLLTALAPWVLRWSLTGRPPARTGFELPALLFLATAGLAVWSAYDRAAAWDKFWWIVGALVIGRALASAAQSGRSGVQWAALALNLATAGLAVYFAATNDWNAYPPKVAWLTAIGRRLQEPLPFLPGHRIHPNVVGGMLAVLLPFAVASAFGLPNRPLRAIGWMAAAAGATALLLSQSRGAWLSVGIAAVLAALWLLIGRLAPQRRRLWFVAVLALPTAVALLLFWVAPAVAAALVSLFIGDANRLLLIREGLVLALDYPVIGAGLGGFQMLHAVYARLLHVGFSTHAHNLYLDVAIEQGLPALLALLAGWGLLIGRFWRQAGRPEANPLLGAAVLALTIIALHGLVDDVFYGSRGLLLLYAPLAFGGAPDGRRPWRQRAVIWAAVAAGLSALTVVVFWRPLQAVWWANRAAVRQSQLELAAYRWPEWPLPDTLRRARAAELEPIAAEYRRALAAQPALASANRRLGQIELSLGRYAEARRLLEVAYAARPWDGATRQLLGEAYLATGSTAEGQVLLRTVYNGQGQLTLRAYWYDSLGETETAAQLRALTARP